ncbi:MAG: heparinase II/III family protein [Opitutaceae bacterium]|nr:heparinase II/III family protein [Opitutaceae bacterium]
MITSRIFRGGIFAPVLLASIAAAAEPLFDWSDWQSYRGTVQHPSGALKPADLARARENLQRYAWARSHLAGLEQNSRTYLARLTPEFLALMIPETTPGDSKFTPCPACRESGKPVHPHGMWNWHVTSPDQLTCEVCHTIYPNERHPETVVLEPQTRKSQRLAYYGGEPFVIFSYRTGRPSFTGNIRARKVGFMSSLARSMAEAYLLTGKTEYAAGVRLILLRFAACYPGWLVHTGYGEYADMDARVAAEFINQLPEPELCPPPNQPDRRLHTGYWTAGRATGGGQESGFVRKMVEAYDFTCTAHGAEGRPLYADDEREKIERDLLLESTVLLVADKQINNKSVGNRTAAALVGLCVGHPRLVRFGWEGFQRTVDGWFLPDGTTSESPAYAMMTLGNIWDLPQALRGYSDPPGYRDASGQRLDGVDLYHGTSYGRAWEACFKGLQGNLRYPPFADSYPSSGLGSHFVELMVANYPEHPEYLSLLKETSGRGLTRSHVPVALYYREPGLEEKPAPPLRLPDWCAPELRIGHLRTGNDGRESLLLLSASHWGGHHHLDSLNLYYAKHGTEVLSDLGYLWDHPRKSQTTRTVAHNTVLIDEKEQVTKERGGDVLLFRTSAHVKVMEASSRAYPGAKLYRRTSAIIDHGGGRNYVVDFFRVAGGQRQDFVYHAAVKAAEFDGASFAPATSPKFYDFGNVCAAGEPGVWRATWKNGEMNCMAWNVGQKGERAFVADGWGQRDWRNSDLGATLPYIVRRTEGDAARTFITVFEAHEGVAAFVRQVTLVDPAGILTVETADGTDYVMSHAESGTLAFAGQRLTGHFAVGSTQRGAVSWTFVEPGER